MREVLSTPSGPMPTMTDCGTTAAYQRHYKRGEPACDDCKRASAEYQKKRYHSDRSIRRHSKSAIPMVIDVLSTYTEWMAIETLIGRVQLHQPLLTDEAILQAVRRLRRKGRLQVRQRGAEFQYFTDEWAATA